MSDLNRLAEDLSADPHFAKKLALFKDISSEQINHVLLQCPQKVIAKGDTLLEPGQPNHHLFFLLAGCLEIRLKSVDSAVADTIEVGDCIGEMSIIDGEPTSAFVVAKIESKVLAVHESVFWSKIAVEPATVRSLSRVLAERMRKRNEATLRALEKEIRLEQLQSELSAAFEIQSGILPPGPRLLPGVESLDVYAITKVVKTVGGDFYDAFPVNDEQVCIAAGDVSGKGMPAALFMVRAMTLLRTTLSSGEPLENLMSQFNQSLCDTNIAHMFVSLIVLRINVITGEVEYVNAGHSPMLVSDSSSYSEANQARGLIAGVLRDTTYEVERLKLAFGSRLFLYTDGVTEARNQSRKFYGLSRLLGTLNEASGVTSEAPVRAVLDDVATFSDKMPPSDDITLVAIRFR